MYPLTKKIKIEGFYLIKGATNIYDFSFFFLTKKKIYIYIYDFFNMETSDEPGCLILCQPLQARTGMCLASRCHQNQQTCLTG